MKISGESYFVVCCSSRSTLESQMGDRRYYDPQGRLTEIKDEAARFVSLSEVETFIKKHGIVLDEFCFIGSVLF